MRLKLIPVIFFFVIIFSSFSSGYSVEPVWTKGEFFQDTPIQFEINGDTNQTNISCKVSYYYPYSEDFKKEAVKWMSIPRLDENGTGVFEFMLNDINGFNRIGGYNITFIFGVDLLNETGIEIYTAPRVYEEIMVSLNPQAIIDADVADDERDEDRMLAWGTIIGNGLWILFSLIVIIVMILIIREIKPVEIWKKFKVFCSRGSQYIGALWSKLKFRKAFRNPAIYFNYLGSLFLLKATNTKKNKIDPLERKLDSAYKNLETNTRLSEKYFKKEEEVLRADKEDKDTVLQKELGIKWEMPKTDAMLSNPGTDKKKKYRKRKK